MNMVHREDFAPPEPPHPFREPRPDDLPISAAAWDAAKRTGGDAGFLLPVLFAAIKQLEAEVAAIRDH